MFRRIRAKIPMFGIIRARIPMFGRIRSKFQCLEGSGQSSNVWRDKVRISIFGRIRS